MKEVVITMPDKIYVLDFKMSDGTTHSVEFTAPQGPNGLSAYDYAKNAGYTGTEEEFAAALARSNDSSIENYIVNDLDTDASDKVLSAAQGVALKNMIMNIDESVNEISNLIGGDA